MHTTLVIAAHNEGDRLWRTVRSCVETCASLDYEIVIADDSFCDGSVTEVERRFPHARIVRHEERRGASPTKALGARHARGDVLVFLDGHCHPEPGAITRLVEDVEHLKGRAIVTPAIPALCTARWKNAASQVGHGYRLDLERFDCGWLPLEALRAAPHRGRQFYESPALIGCALAISRELYDELWGFDPHMLFWGVEDLDFGLKCWLMGYPILHDPKAVIGHRFRQTFDNYAVPLEQLLVNQLRMARKQFAPGVWSEWLDLCRQRHSGRLKDHPEGLWARVWTLFEEHRASAESERAYLQSRRVRDEFWYAERFDLGWPRLQSQSTYTGAAVPQGIALFQSDPSPSPPPCDVTGIIPASVTACVGKDVTFTAAGANLDDVTWSGGGTPATGSGATFTTQWDTTGSKQVTASCGDSAQTATVTVVRITFGADRIRTGFTKPVSTSTIVHSTFLTCDPPGEVANVTLHVTGEDRVDLQDLQVISGAGQLLFSVKGTRPTSSGIPNGDTTIEARIGGQTCAKIQAIVVVPTKIHEPYPEADGDVAPQNLVLDASTSPAAWGLPPNAVQLVTAWIQWLTIGVEDQFGDDLDELYEGVDVQERVGGVWRSINQTLTGSGTYQDPVFVFSKPAISQVPTGSQAAQDWPTEPTLTMVAFDGVQNIPVRVDGHPIGAIKLRRVIGTPPNHVEIDWP